MDFRSYVERNQKVIDFINDVTPGHIDKFTGTLDYACARFNTILIKLSQHPLKADQFRNDVDECFNIIQSFYAYTKRFTETSVLLKPFIKLILHYKGTVQVPKIRILMDKINN